MSKETTLVRVSRITYNQLKQISEAVNKPMSALIEEMTRLKFNSFAYCVDGIVMEGQQLYLANMDREVATTHVTVLKVDDKEVWCDDGSVLPIDGRELYWSKKVRNV